MTESGQQPQPGRGRSGRGRGGRRRGAAQGQERGQQSPQAPNRTDMQGPNTSQPPSAAAPDAGAPSSSNRGGGGGGGRGRRGGRNPRRGGGEPRRGGAEPRQRAAHGGRRTFGGHLTSDAASSNNTGSPATLSVEAPEFVPGQQPPTNRNGASGGQASRSTAPKREILPKSTATDLPTRIHEDINNGHYECVICTNEVLRNSRVWSCSICWTVAHLSCVRKWYSNQNKKANEQEGETPTGWRCPGCNSSLIDEPTSYHCWCGKESNPHSIPGLPPHSCNQTCAKPRSTCPHPCGLVCHAGPCPPCGMMGPPMSCFCGKNTSTKRCTETSYSNGWSCAEICGDLLPCGEHECSQPCHSDLCGSCEIPIPSFCYCGKEHKDIACEQRGDRLASYDHGQLDDDAHALDAIADGWYEGSFDCEAACGRSFDCGNHECQKACHAQDQEPAHCPFAPDAVSHCPCGKTQLADILDHPRQNCKDPVPTCGEVCDKPLDCGHKCLSGCHDSSCPPCSQVMDITCRCGRTTTRTVCHQGNLYVPECMRVCRAQLSCGRHNHDLHCCPGEKRAAERVAARRKRKNGATANDEVEAEHICVRVCGRNLKCGKHTCDQMCHTGPCRTCPEAVFEEISCNCGRTVLYPPQPCGTQPPECRYECARSNPACGHPRVSHSCHTDDKPCPPCPFLVEKRCICGKQILKNQPCWFEEPRCGLPCGNKLKCGTHLCTKPCHRPGECEDANIRGSHCQQPCLKVKKLCDHADTDPCHAPYPCKEEKPCQAKTFITCECQHKKQEVRCMASKANPFPDRPPLKCDDECLRLQRNAKLAAALNIDPETHKDNHVPYSDKTLELFKEGVRWAQTQEREFRVFASDSQEKRLRFKPMKSQQRAFLHALAEDFGLDSESQDPEPHRHVSIFKTPRFVSAPLKTLAQCVQIKTANTTEDATAAGAVTNPLITVPYNALLLTAPRFGLTVEDVEAAVAKDLATQPTVTFTTGFLPNDEIVIRGSGTWAAQALETSVTALKPLISQAIMRTDIAKAVFLCHADTSLNVLRREVDPVKNADGWNSVVGRSSAKQARSAAASSSEAKPAAGRKLLMLKKEPKKKVEVEPVEDDWEAAAEKIADDTED